MLDKPEIQRVEDAAAVRAAIRSKAGGEQLDETRAKQWAQAQADEWDEGSRLTKLEMFGACIPGKTTITAADGSRPSRVEVEPTRCDGWMATFEGGARSHWLVVAVSDGGIVAVGEGWDRTVGTYR